MVRQKAQGISHELTDQSIQDTLSWILAASTPDRVYVFGSAARHQLTEDSDLDFAIVFANESELNIQQKAISQRRRPDMWPRDLLFFTAEEFDRKSQVGGVCMIIVEDGRLVFEGHKRIQA